MNIVCGDGGGLPNRLSSPVVRNSTGQKDALIFNVFFVGD
jgi:hypothetical protein